MAGRHGRGRHPTSPARSRRPPHELASHDCISISILSGSGALISFGRLRVKTGASVEVAPVEGGKKKKPINRQNTMGRAGKLPGGPVSRGKARGLLPRLRAVRFEERPSRPSAVTVLGRFQQPLLMGFFLFYPSPGRQDSGRRSGCWWDYLAHNARDKSAPLKRIFSCLVDRRDLGSLLP